MQSYGYINALTKYVDYLEKPSTHLSVNLIKAARSGKIRTLQNMTMNNNDKPTQMDIQDENLECIISIDSEKIHLDFGKEGFLGYEFLDQYHLTPTRLLEVLQFFGNMHDEKDLKLLNKVEDYKEHEI